MSENNGDGEGGDVQSPSRRSMNASEVAHGGESTLHSPPALNRAALN